MDGPNICVGKQTILFELVITSHAARNDDLIDSGGDETWVDINVIIFDGLVQECSNLRALAIELLFSCIKPSI